MADGPPDAGYAPRKSLTWTDTFRLFQVALDPRKLAVAAAGILALAVGWYLLSLLFWAFQDPLPPKREDAKFSNAEMQKKLENRKRDDGTDLQEPDLKAAGDLEYAKATALYDTWAGLAGPGGRIRTLPWYEYRGPNPFVLLSDLAGGTAVDREAVVGRFLSGTVPVLVEPLAKLLLPVVRMFDPAASVTLRLYLLLCLVWAVAVWAFFGGVITRIAAVQLTGKDRVTLPEAVRFVLNRYTGYLLAPLAPIGLMLVIILAMLLYGLVALVPFLGDVVLYGLGLPLVLFGGLVLALLLVGLVGYPLMNATISTEGTDAFDALSRAYNYVFQAPWTYAGNAVLAILYGAAVTFFVVFAGSLSVYLGKWAVSQAPFSEATNRRPDYLFVYAPESFGWRELLLKGSPAEIYEPFETNEKTGRKTYVTRVDPDTGRRAYYVERNPAAANTYSKSLWLTEKIGAGLAAVWTTLVLLLVVGFSYSYFWSASTLIYLAMRQKVDETEPDEVYLDDDEPEPLPPPATTTATGPAAGGLDLPTVPPAPATSTPGVPLSPNVVAPPGSTLTTTAVPPPAPPPAAAASPEVANPVKADGTALTTGPASVSPPPPPAGEGK